MRTTANVLTILAMAAGAALADTITIKNIPYSDVRLVEAANCRIVYELRGRNYEKPLADVSFVQLDGQADLNKAEQLAKAGKAAEAVAAYDKAAGVAVGKPAIVRLIRYRRLAALDEAGMIGRAVEDWLAIVDECSASSASLGFCPSKAAPKGSDENVRAIELLEPRLAGAKAPGLQVKLRQLLANLNAAEGRQPKAAPGVPPPPGAEQGTATPDGPEIAVTAAAGATSAALRGAVDQFNAGQYAPAAQSIQERLRKFDEKELPAALLLRGKALLMMYDKGVSQNRQTLLDAGLSFMRAAACFDLSFPEVPEATFWAAQVCERLGNPVAAQNAYRFLIQRFEGTEWGEKAQGAMQAAGGGAPSGPGMGD